MFDHQNIKNKAYSVLRWSEKWLKTDMVYLAENGFWITLGHFFYSSSALLLSIAFAYFLAPEIYGMYKYILAFCGVLAITNLPGMEAAITRAVAQKKEGVVIPAIKTKIKWGLMGGTASLLIGAYYLYSENRLLGYSFIAASIFLPIMDSFSPYASILQGKKDFKTSTAYLISSQLFTTIAILTAIFFTRNLYILVLTYFASWTLSRYIALQKTLKKYPLNDTPDQETISYGKHLSLSYTLPAIAGYFDRLILFHFVGPAEVAIYSIAVAPVEQIKGLFKNIYSLALPKFSEKNKESIDKSIKQKMPKLIGLLIAIIIIYVIAAPFLFHLFFPKYPQSIFLSQIYAIVLISVAVFLPYTSLEATASTKKIYYYNIFTSLIQIALLLALTPLFGVMGVISARIISRFFNLGLSISLNKTATI